MPFIGNVTSIQIHRIPSPHFTTVYVKTRSHTATRYYQTDRSMGTGPLLGFLVFSLRSTAERKPSNTAKKHVHPKPISARAAYINSSCQCWLIRLGLWPPIQLHSGKISFLEFYSMALKDALNGSEVTFSVGPQKKVFNHYDFAMRVLI